MAIAGAAKKAKRSKAGAKATGKTKSSIEPPKLKDPKSGVAGMSLDDMMAGMADGDFDDDDAESDDVTGEASDADEDDERARLRNSGGSDDDDDDESSAGAFHDVGSDDDDDDAGIPAAPRGVVEELDDEEDDGDQAGAGARHAEELKAIKEKDPEFYKFLVEQDKALLDFEAPEEGADEEGQDEGFTGADLEGSAADHQGRILTRERWSKIQASAPESFTAFKAALNIYHIAVRSIEKKSNEANMEENAQDGDEEEEGGKPGKKNKKGKRAKEQSEAAQRRAARALFRIDDEAIFSEVIEWSIANVLTLLRQHAGELPEDATKAATAGKKGGKEGKKKQKSKEEAGVEKQMLDPTRFSRWKRVRTLAHIFWQETFFLLSTIVSQQMLEFVLRSTSSPEGLAWLWPFKPVRQRFLKRCCQLWSNAKAHNVRVLSFLFLRNAAAMIKERPDSPKTLGPQMEGLLRGVIRYFAEAAQRGYSWKNVSTFRFMENCIVELLKIDDATTYRLGYVCIRQLALILRNGSLAVSAANSGGGAGAKAKGHQGEESERVKKRKKAALQQAQVLVAWPFIRGLSLWTKAVGAVAALRPLAFPLSQVITGAVKHKQMSLQFFPFTYHCLVCLNQLGSSLEAFVPVSALLLKALTGVMAAMEKAARSGPRGKGAERTLDSSVRAPDLEVTLKLSEAQLSESLALEAVASSLCFLFTDHLGLLSQSPALPELSAPVLQLLRRHAKQCRSDPLRRQLKLLVEKTEAANVQVKARRDALVEPPDGSSFLIFEADTPIAKARVEALARKANEEKTRVEAEARKAEASELKAGETGELGDEAGEEEEAKGKKMKKKRKAAADEGEAEKPKKKKKKGPSAAATAIRAGALPDKDRVEEMDFSSGEE